ncbi:MAG: ATP-binding cassette domain-containing protein [Candidatus Latescibacteria bacterium]|nr:ATP-binding cassette domain-containing protein [Candidatus Latescibacterota bacterium]
MGNTTVLEDVSLQVEKGEFVFLLGSSGAGKSTVLRLIHFDERPTQGWVRLEDYNSSTIKSRHIPPLRRRVGMIFQDFKLLKDRNIFDNVAFALQVTGAKKTFMKRRVLQTLALVGLGHLRNMMPAQLSGGEQQRASIARALVNQPFALLADEPLGDLDKEAASDILQLLRELNHQGTTVLMATHDAELVETLPYRCLRIERGKIL